MRSANAIWCGLALLLGLGSAASAPTAPAADAAPAPVVVMRIAGVIGVPSPGESPAASGAASGAAATDTMTAKRTADAAAYLRGLAQLRGRNADWAERAVRESVSLAAPEALKLGVIELVAQDLPD